MTDSPSHQASGSRPSWLDRAHPDDRRYLETEVANLRDARQLRELTTVGRFRVANEASPEASYRWSRVHLERDAGGEVTASFEALDRSAGELDCLAARIRRLETMLATVPECFKVLDQDLCLVDMNDTGLHLIESEGLDQVRGVSVLELLLPPYHETFQREMRSTLEGERTVLRFEIEGLEGTRRWMEQVAVALPPLAGDGGAKHIAAFTRDITDTKLLIAELRAAREHAEAASVAKSEFLANMSHEIRTPMTAILGFVDLLADPDLSEAERDEFLQTVRVNGVHLLSVLNDVLDLAKIESGKLEVDLQPHSPAAIVEEVATLMRVRAEAKELELSVSFESPLPERVETDGARLKQILLNLVGNAVKFTQRGRVSIACRAEGEPDRPVLRFSIRDTGIGMTSEELGRVFEAFAQADASVTRRFGGTGLGLNISQKLALLLDGELRATSTPGRGSEFELLVPLRLPRSGATRSPKPRREPAPSRPLEGRRILLVEDGRDNQRLIGFLLRRAGASVTAAFNGREGLETTLESVASGEPFDLVLMDMQMPVMDGYSATRAMRERGVRLPVVALTAHALEEDRQRCLEAGCDDFASKPLDFRAFIELCATWTSAPERRRAG